MAQYATEQKKILMDFLRAHREEAFSVEALIEGMRAEQGAGAIPATSTVYRLITKLVEEGEVRRFVKGHSRHFVYQIVDGEHCHAHLHLRCTDCGRLLHLDESVSEEILRSVMRESSFAVSEGDTVLLGRCRCCRGEGSSHA